MSDIPLDDIEYDLNCECEESCDYDGCKVKLLVGPCEFLEDPANPSLADFCQPATLTEATFNPDQTIREKQYLGSCFETTKRGNFKWTLDFTVEPCDNDEAICRLLNWGCLIGVALMPRGNTFDPALNADQQAGIFYGLARVGSGPWSFPFDEDQTISGQLMSHGRLFSNGICTVAGLTNPV